MKWKIENMVGKIEHGDCTQVLPMLPDKCADLVLTDPPYGLGDKWQGGPEWASVHNNIPDWDYKIPSDSAIQNLFRVGKNCIVWGGNYFNVPPSRCWLSWDKMQKFSGADFELAYTTFDRPCKCFRLSRVEAYGSIERLHPTQKPLPLFKWCIEMFTNPGDLVIDPYAGSGTTALACSALGRRFICLERSAEYVEVARNRLAEFESQVDFFPALIQNKAEAAATTHNTCRLPLETDNRA